MNGAAGARNAFPEIRSELAPLVHLSARIGRDPLLVQASSGNTSVKLDGVLWIKASGKWMADADRHDMFVPVSLTDAKARLQADTDLAVDSALSAAPPMSASIETFMHAVVPHRVVVHVHSVNTIAWAVRQDAPSELAQKLSGLRWHCIPYTPSGRPLAREIEKVTSSRPETDVFILGNHGLVICGEACDAAEDLLGEVERRLMISPRRAALSRRGLLEQLARMSPWRLPEMEGLHALGTDAISRRIMRGGVLYPCQAIFLGQPAPMMPCSVPISEVRGGVGGQFGDRPFLIVEGSGVMLNQKITRAELAVLIGLAEVIQRIGVSAPVRYLTPGDVAGVLSGDGYRYRASAENNQSASAISCA